jgi:hypothetical protein
MLPNRLTIRVTKSRLQCAGHIAQKEETKSAQVNFLEVTQKAERNGKITLR